LISNQAREVRFPAEELPFLLPSGALFQSFTKQKPAQGSLPLELERELLFGNAQNLRVMAASMLIPASLFMMRRDVLREAPFGMACLWSGHRTYQQLR